MKKEEHDNWIVRATPFIGQEYPIKELDPIQKKNISVMYNFTSISRSLVMKEQQKGDKGKPQNYSMPKALLVRDQKQKVEPLNKVVLHFEANA